MSQPTEQPAATGRTLLVFRCSNHLFAFPAGSVKEVLHMAALSTPPGLPPFVPGFLNFASEAVPVIDLSQLFDLGPTPEGLYTSLILLGSTGKRTAIRVERILEVISAREEDLLPVDGSQVFNGMVTATLCRGGERIAVLSPKRLLLEQEERHLESFKEMARKRLSELRSP